MKNYLKMIKQLFLNSTKEILFYVLAVLGGGLFGTVISIIIVATGEGDGYSTLGALMGAVFAGILLLFGTALGGQLDFQLSVSMNRARLPYLVAKYIVVTFEIALSLGLCYGIKAIERMVGNARGEFTDLFNISGVIIALTVLGLPVILLLFAALYTKYERKFFWVLWGIYMVVALGAPRIGTAMSKHPDSTAAKIGFFFKEAIDTNTVQFAIVAVVAVLIVAGVNVLLYKKTEVKL